MRKSTIILSLALIAILSMGSKTIYNWYAPLTAGNNGQLLTSAGTNAHPTWLSSGTAGQILVSGGANTSPSWQGATVSLLSKQSCVTQGDMIFYKIGKLCVLCFHNIMVNSSASGLLVGYIPSGCNPKYQISSVGASGQAAKYCCLSALPDGRIVLWGQSADYNIYGQLVWMCE